MLQCDTTHASIIIEIGKSVPEGSDSADNPAPMRNSFIAFQRSASAHDNDKMTYITSMPSEKKRQWRSALGLGFEIGRASCRERV